MIRLIYEDERTAAVRQEIESLDLRQLIFLEEIIKKQIRSRRNETYNQWLNALGELCYNNGKK